MQNIQQVIQQQNDFDQGDKSALYVLQIWTKKSTQKFPPRLFLSFWEPEKTRFRLIEVSFLVFLKVFL